MPHSNDNDGIHVLRDATEKPPGVLPRRTQQYIIVGLALLIILIALFSGHTAKPAGQTQVRSVPDPQSPNPAAISAYEHQLQQLQISTESAAPRRDSHAQSAQLAPQAMAATGSGEPTTTATSQPNPTIQQQRLQQQKLMYQSLFASNIALSYRTPAPGAAQPSTNSLDAQVAQLLAGAGLAGAGSVPASAPIPKAPSPAPPPTSSTPAAPIHQTGVYVLAEGTIIPTVLLNRLIGDLPGPVECMVASDVYSQDRQDVLIPSGSRVLGSARPVSAFGQQRLAVSFDRLILPDGASFRLDHFTGLNPSGATGLHDQVNNHYWRIFGASMAIGLVGGAAEVTAAPAAETGRGLYIEGAGSGLSQASTEILDKFLNIMPTITIREGHRVAIYLTHDLLLPAYGAPAD